MENNNRYKELIGTSESEDKKQLVNEYFQEEKKLITESKSNKKIILQEEVFFNVEEFENDGIGDDGKENGGLYKMDKPKKKS